MPDYTKSFEEEMLIAFGRTFIVSEDGDVTNISILLENPQDSGVHPLFYFGEVTHEDTCQVTVYDEVSGVSGGDVDTHRNNHIGHDYESQVTSRVNPTFTGEEEHQAQGYAGSDTESVFDGYKVMLHPGETVVVEIQDTSGGNKLSGIRVAWAEIENGTFDAPEVE